MADDVVFQSTRPATPPSAEVIAADDVDGVKYQRMKLVTGADGEVIGDASDQYPLPVRDHINAEILLELRKLNIYMSLILGQEVSDNDVYHL